MPRGRRAKQLLPILIEENTDKDIYDDDTNEIEEQEQNDAKRLRRGPSVHSFYRKNIARSSKKLADIGLDFLEEETLRDIISKLPQRHPNEKASLRLQYESQFGEWWVQLDFGNNVLLYGFGSKISLLDTFARSMIIDGSCLAVNGLQRSVTSHQILQWSLATLKGGKASTYSHYSEAALIDLIGNEFEEYGYQKRLYIVIHSIDGPGLRDPKTQSNLALLAALPRVHIIASVDHVNASLLWDLQTRDRFSWVWYNVTNFEPYTIEVAHLGISSLLLGNHQESSKQAASVVLSSLSHNAREVFKVIAGQQLDDSEGNNLSFQRLFTMCRERFLVSNEMLLKSFLTEYRDHELLQTKRGSEGVDVLYIPLSHELLQKVLDDMENI